MSSCHDEALDRLLDEDDTSQEVTSSDSPTDNLDPGLMFGQNIVLQDVRGVGFDNDDRPEHLKKEGAAPFIFIFLEKARAFWLDRESPGNAHDFGMWSNRLNNPGDYGYSGDEKRRFLLMAPYLKYTKDSLYFKFSYPLIDSDIRFVKLLSAKVSRHPDADGYYGAVFCHTYKVKHIKLKVLSEDEIPEMATRAYDNIIDPSRTNHRLDLPTEISQIEPVFLDASISRNLVPADGKPMLAGITSINLKDDSFVMDGERHDANSSVDSYYHYKGNFLAEINKKMSEKGVESDFITVEIFRTPGRDNLYQYEMSIRKLIRYGADWCLETDPFCRRKFVPQSSSRGFLKLE